MITKAKKVQYTTSDGKIDFNLDSVKRYELELLCEVGMDDPASKAFSVLITKPHEAIAILKFGLPRKPRTVKAKAGKAKKAPTAPVVTTLAKQ